MPIRIVFFDAWHTLFTVRVHGPQRLINALRELELTFDEAQIGAAMTTARDRIKALNLPFIATPEQEREYFHLSSGYVLETLGLEAAHTAELARRSLYVPHCYLYEDTLPALDGVRDMGIGVGLLSNAWPSLLDALTGLNIIERFKPLIVSAFVGSEKPDHGIYLAALEQAGVAPDEAIFVDDLPPNIVAADEVGMVGVLIDRDDQHTDTPLRRITKLTDLFSLLEK